MAGNEAEIKAKASADAATFAGLSPSIRAALLGCGAEMARGSPTQTEAIAPVRLWFQRKSKAAKLEAKVAEMDDEVTAGLYPADVVEAAKARARAKIEAILSGASD